jgi:hypothetical protein
MENLKISCLDMDNVLRDFPSALSHISDEQKQKYVGRFDEILEIFACMEPLAGAPSAFEQLSNQHHHKYGQWLHGKTPLRGAIS